MAKQPPAKQPPPPESPGIPQPPAVVEISPHFKLVFVTTAVLTFTFFAAATVIAIRGGESDTAKEVASGCLTMAKIGFGAIVGLLGGKAL